MLISPRYLSTGAKAALSTDAQKNEIKPWLRQQWVIPDAQALTREVAAWEPARNVNPHLVNWRFTTPDARIKLKRLYPSIQSG